MKRSFPTFSSFFLAQLLLWAAAGKNNIASGEEILIETIFIGVFIALFFAGYSWARWAAVALLGSVGLLIGSMTFEGFGIGFLSVALLYGAVIIMLFRVSPASKAKRTVKHIESEPDVIDWPQPPETKPSFGNTFQAGEDRYRYPLLVKRYQSLLIDFLVLSAIMVVTMVVMGESEARQTVMVSMGIVFALFYEPVLTTYAATLGQYITGIRVRDVSNPKERINIFQAYLRIIVKWLLGWLSFVTINFNPQHRAIHDMAGSSVVIKHSPPGRGR